MSDLEDFGTTEPKGISRRTVTKAMAWAVPVIAVASAAPAFAASNGIVQLTGAGCKTPGNGSGVYKGYAFQLTISNTTDNSVSISNLSGTLDGSSLGSLAVLDLNTCTLVALPINVGPNTTLSNLALVSSLNPNSQNGSLVVSFTVSGQTGNATATASGLNPITGDGTKVGGSCSENTFTEAQQMCIAGATWNV
jgi:hypothetical protein